LVNGRCDHRLGLHIAAQPSREHVGLTVGIEVRERVHRIAQAKHGDLLAVDQRRDAAAGKDVLELANALPGGVCSHTASLRRFRRSSAVAGRIWPRSWMKMALSSARSLLTKCRKRLSVWGSSMAFFHSHS